MSTPNFGGNNFNGDQPDPVASGHAASEWDAAPAFPADAGYPAGSGAASTTVNPVEAQKPGLGRRFSGYVIDNLLLMVVAFVVMMIYIMTSVDIPSSASEAETNAALEDALTSANWIIALLGIVFLGYRIIMEMTAGGSVGKLTTGQRVVTEQGTRLGFLPSLIRNSFLVVLFVISFLPQTVGVILGLIIQIGIAVTIAQDPQNRSIFDRWAGATVIRKQPDFAS